MALITDESVLNRKHIKKGKSTFFDISGRFCDDKEAKQSKACFWDECVECLSLFDLKLLNLLNEKVKKYFLLL